LFALMKVRDRELREMLAGVVESARPEKDA